MCIILIRWEVRLVNGGSAKKEYADPGWSAWETVIVMGLAMLLSAVPYWFSASARGIGADLVSYVLQTGCFFLCPLLLASLRHHSTPEALGFTAADRSRCLRTGVGWGLLLYLMNVLISYGQSLLFPQYQPQEYIVALLDRANGFETVFLLLLLLVMAPAAEETLFRAFFFPALLHRYGRTAGYILCAVVFAAAHFDPWTLLPIFIASLGLCRLYEKYHCLWYNIIAHATWNGVALIIYYFTSLK